MSDYMQEWNENYQRDVSWHKNIYPSELLVSWIFRNFREKKLRALDIGCGYGNNLRFLLENGFDAEGFDFSSSVIEEIKAEFGSKVSCQTAQKMNYDSNTFDLLIDRNSLQHNPIEHLDDIFCECRRVLKDDGHMFTSFLTSGKNDFQSATLNEAQLIEIVSRYFNIKTYKISEKSRVY